MSYENKGSMATTVVVSLAPDRSGNYVCDATVEAHDVTIQRALDHVGGLGGGQVICLRGQYNLTTSVDPSNDTTLTGMGYDTLFYLVDASEDHVVHIDGTGVAKANITIEKIRIDGNGAGQVGGVPNLNGIMIEGDCTKIIIQNNWVEDVLDLGIATWGLGGAVIGVIIANNVCYNNGRDGIAGDYTIHDITVTGNLCQDNGDWGIGYGASTYDITISGNVCSGNDKGLYIADGCYDMTIDGNIIVDSVTKGVHIVTNVIYCSITNNIITGNADGLWFETGCNYNLVDGNTIRDNNAHGIRIYASHHNTISNNIIIDNSQGGTNTNDGIRIDGTSTYNNIIDNYIYSTESPFHKYCVNIVAAADANNRVIGNILGGAATSLILDAGAGTVLDAIPIPLIQGTTFISAAGEAWGWEIDADTEYALGIGWLPLKVQQVVRIRVIGVGLAAPGAGNYMRIQITGEGATFDEVFTTEPIDVVDHNNEEVNFAINDVINWVFTASEDADIGHLLGGDRLQIKVLHEGAGNGDIATDSIVDSIQVEYV